MHRLGEGAISDVVIGDIDTAPGLTAATLRAEDRIHHRACTSVIAGAVARNDVFPGLDLPPLAPTISGER